MLTPDNYSCKMLIILVFKLFIIVFRIGGKEQQRCKYENMEKKITKIGEIPAIIWGTCSPKVYFYIHGQGGNKEEAETLFSIASLYGWQVISIDLPGHGSRTGEINSFVPWRVVPELKLVMEYIKSQWEYIALYGSSIGAWFSMLSFKNEKFENCLFVSPILDMKAVISNMMIWANVSEERLEQELFISTSFGQTLSWNYWKYVLEHPITDWKTPTKILYPENDTMTAYDVVDRFVHRFESQLTVMKNGEHWFHTPQQIDYMCKWIETSLSESQ